MAGRTNTTGKSLRLLFTIQADTTMTAAVTGCSRLRHSPSHSLVLRLSRNLVCSLSLSRNLVCSLSLSRNLVPLLSHNLVLLRSRNPCTAANHLQAPLQAR